MTAVDELSPTAFRARWPDGERERVLLLDVRNPDEVALAKVAQAVHIPMQDLPGRLAELDPKRPTVVMCHTGVRSRHVAGFLLASGFEQVHNLAGGIDAWSTELDPTVPRY